MLNLVWFRNDLRILDNPALSSAMNSGVSIALYCLTEDQWDMHGDSHAKRSLIIRQLYKLEHELSKLNVPLIVRRTVDFNGAPNALADFIHAHNINHIYFNLDYGLNELLLTNKVEEKAAHLKIKVSTFHDQCLIQPGSIRTQQGSNFHVFSAFKRAFQKRFNDSLRPLYDLPLPQKTLTNITSDLTALEQTPHIKTWDHLWPAGEEFAHGLLSDFLEHKIHGYNQVRDIPSRDGTSAVSPYLTIGALSTSQCIRAAVSLNHGELNSGNEGINTWINELIWREFYRHLLFAYPNLSRYKPFKLNTDDLPWRQDGNALEAWKNGQTGYPIVDAAMRQLKATAWMHNRLRMIVAMFLTKHLFIDWRQGERYFMEQLVDGDLASNNGGWQWSASTGVDAAPYFRIFNPTRQSERFDPEGEFLRTYLPELKSLDNRSIHNPSKEQRLELGYQMPIVDHAKATEYAKAQFKKLSKS